MSTRSEARAGARAVAPMLLGVVPFGLVAGAAPAAQGLAKWSALGLSSIVFAGASQLAIVDVLGHGGTALVAILAAWTINLRMVLYSASLAPYLASVPTRRRLAAAYFLTDQSYVLSITRWSAQTEEDHDHRLAFYFGGAVLLCACWLASTTAGVLLGGVLPDETPLDFAVPLVFLVLLIPVLTNRPSVIAAVVGGAAAVAAAQFGAGGASIVIGSALGIAAGAFAEARAT